MLFVTVHEILITYFMKKITLLLLFVSVITYGQTTKNEPPKKNYKEIRVNGLYFSLGAIELTYEQTLNEESAIGVSAFLPFDNKEDIDFEYYISPYYRFYFGKKHASGFFVEGFGMLNSTKEYNFFTGTEDVTNFALGVGLGGKWVTKGGFTGELNLGIGRNLFNGDTGNEVIGKIGISIGYRF